MNGVWGDIYDFDEQSAPQPLTSEEPRESLAELLAGVLDGSLSRPPRERITSRDDYRERYLRSEHWRQFRALMIGLGGKRCEDCDVRPDSTTDLDVHHLTYERLGCEAFDDVVVVCRDCHDKRHRGAS